MHSPIHPLKNWALFLKSPEAFQAYFWCQDFLYLRNAEVLSHQASHSPKFPYIKKQADCTLTSGSFRVRKVLETFEKQSREP